MPLTCTLQMPARVAAGQPALLQFSLHNAGAEALQVLTWATPLEGTWFAPFVQVKRGHDELRYRGPQLKRGDPPAEQYVRVDAGATQQGRIDLALVFDLRQPGQYVVTPNIALHDVFAAGTDTVPRPRSRHRRVELDCPPVSFTVER